MIDVLAILASCGLLVVMIRQAIRLNRELPWFTPLADSTPAEPAKQPPPGGP